LPPETYNPTILQLETDDPPSDQLETGDLKYNSFYQGT
jgi:hypothetical protein